MSRFLTLLLLVLAIMAGYFYIYPDRFSFLNQLEQVTESLSGTTKNNDLSESLGKGSDTSASSEAPTRSEAEATDQEDDLPPMSPEQREEAQAQLDKMVDTAEVVLDARQVNQFVTGDQLLQLPQTADARTQIALDESSKKSQLKQGEQAKSFGVTLAPFKPNSESIAANGTTNEQIIHLNQPSIGTKIQLKELLNNPNSNDGKRIFYIHAVNPNDAQGIWGILQSGLTDTFAKGMSLSDKEALIKAQIPKEADEVLANRQSSFLGKLLHNKVETTYIYNYEQGLLGQNPNLIKPGQQLIIVTFTEDELLKVYQHFTQAGE